MKPKKLILIVDDSKEIRILVKISLEMAGFEVIEAENGKEGVDFAKAFKPDLIISDFAMPVMNGLEGCKILKTDPDTKHIPIIMLSSFPFSKNMLLEFHEIGLNAYLMKPYEYELLFEKINELLKEPQFFNEIDISLKKEVRRSERYNTFTHATVEINAHTYIVRIKNMSREGFSLVIPENTEVGSLIKVKVTQGTSDIEGIAKIVWVNKERNSENFLAGLEMQSITV